MKLTGKQIIAAMRPHLDEGDGGYLCDRHAQHVIAAGEALLKASAVALTDRQILDIAERVWAGAAFSDIPTRDAAVKFARDVLVAAGTDCNVTGASQLSADECDQLLSDPNAMAALADGLESITGNENAALAAIFVRREAQRLASADERAAFARAEISFPMTIPRNRVYLAGPMTGYENHNFPAFHAAAERLRASGLEVVNPADHGLVDGLGWADYMRWDLVKLAGCHSVYVLPGWEKSKGASLEVSIAQALGMPVLTVDGAALASAPVAGEAQPVAWGTTDDREPISDALKRAHRRYAAPQAMPVLHSDQVPAIYGDDAKAICAYLDGWNACREGKLPQEYQAPGTSYAGVTVWVGNKQCTRVVSAGEMQATGADVLRGVFEAARTGVTK